METKKLHKLEKRINKIRNLLSEEVGSSTMDLIDELIALEIELEAECNQ